jgi:hypothetical protein
MNSVTRRLQVSLKPALFHLGICAFIAFCAMGFIFLAWYPSPLDVAQGVSRLVLILICVDVVLGPMITIIVYDPAKKLLWFDLITIAVLQAAALTYGLHAIQDGRPAYVVFNVDRFDVIATKDVVLASEARAAAVMQRRMFGPKWVAARLPADPTRRNDILFSAVGGGPDLPQMPEFFVSLEEERSTMIAELRPMKQLKLRNEINDGDWAKLIASFGKSENELGYLPMAANVKDGAVILDAKSGEILGIRLLEPDFSTKKKPQDHLLDDSDIPVAPVSKPRPMLQGMG